MLAVGRVPADGGDGRFELIRATIPELRAYVDEAVAKAPPPTHPPTPARRASCRASLPPPTFTFSDHEPDL